MQAKLVDAGIDYVRVTSDKPGPMARMLSYFLNVAQRDAALGYKVQKGGCFGFYGDKTRHALYGRKKEWALLQASGYEAKRALLLTHEGSQASRIDLQLTYRVETGTVEKTIREAYKAACAHDAPERRHMQVSLIEQRGKAQTVYLGSRASDIFFRIYDKFEESGKEEYRDCVRFELELKGRASKALWQQLITGQMNLTSALQMVVHMLAERGVVTPCQDIQDMDIMLPPRQKTSEESTAAWLRKQVSPVLRRLTNEHNWMYAFNAVFDGVICEWERHRVTRSLAICWGS